MSILVNALFGGMKECDDKIVDDSHLIRFTQIFAMKYMLFTCPF